MSQAEWIKCVCCGWHWKRLHTGQHKLEHQEGLSPKGEFSFGKGDPDTDAFISIRDLPGGKANPRSFREIDRINLEQAKNKPEYQELINSLKEKIEKIQTILKD